MLFRSFYRETAFQALRATLEEEHNPGIQAVALEGVAGYAKPEVQDLLLRFLGSTSYRNLLAEAALRGCRLQDDPALVGPVLLNLRQHEQQYTTDGFVTGLEVLGFLARNAENKDDVREFLLAQAQHQKRSVPPAAIRALGILGDERAIGPLRKFASAGEASAEREAAQEALAQLRAGRKPVDDFKNLRGEMLELQQADRDLRRELEELRRKLDKLGETSAE